MLQRGIKKTKDDRKLFLGTYKLILFIKKALSTKLCIILCKNTMFNLHLLVESDSKEKELLKKSVDRSLGQVTLNLLKYRYLKNLFWTNSI